MVQQSFPDPPDVAQDASFPDPPDVGEIDIPDPPDVATDPLVGKPIDPVATEDAQRGSKVLQFGTKYPNSDPYPAREFNYGQMAVSDQPALKKPFDLEQYEWDKYVAEQRAIGEKALAESPEGARHFGAFSAGLSALGAPAENQIELYDLRQKLNRGEISLTDFLSRAGRTALAALPGVPPPEVEDKYKIAAMRAGLANEKLRKDEFWRGRVTQDVIGGAAFLGKFAGIRAPLASAAEKIGSSVARPGLKLLLGAGGAAKTPLEAFSSGLAVSAPTMGLMAAEPALEEGRFKDAAVDFAGGMGTDVMLRGATLAGGGAVNQLNKATGSRLSEAALARLRPGGAAVGQSVAMTAQDLDNPQLVSQAGSNLLSNLILSYTPGLNSAMPGMKAMREQQRQRPMDEFQQPDSVPTGDRTTEIPLQGDPSFEMMTRGERAFHFLPDDGKSIMLTPAERALKNKGIPEIDDLVEIKTDTGTVRFRDKAKAEEVFRTPEAADVVVWKRNEDGFNTSEVDIDASVKKATALGKEGVFLQYGKGNESKADPRDPNARLVTLYDRFGREVTSILANNPDTAVEALQKHHGGNPLTGARIVVRPMSEAMGVLAERAKAKVIDEQIKAKAPKSAPVEEEIPPPPDTTGLTPEQINKQSASKGALYDTKSSFSYLKDIPEAEPVYKALLARHAAFNYANQMGTYNAGEIHRKVNNPKLVSLAMKYLYDANVEGLVAQGRPVEDHLFLNQQERATAAANKSKIMEIVEEFRRIKRQASGIATSAGVQSSRPVGPDAEYIHMTPVDLTMTEVGGKVRFSEQLNRLIALQKKTGAPQILADKEILEAIEKGEPVVGSKEHKILQSRGLLRPPTATKAGAARYAAAKAKAYSLDAKDVIESTLLDLSSAASQNELIAGVRKLQLKPDAQGKVPTLTTFGGKVVNAKGVEIGTTPSWMGGEEGKVPNPEWATVPEPIKMAIEESRKYESQKTNSAVRNLMSEIVKADTGFTLADSPSTFLHYLYAVATTPGMAGSGKFAKAIEAFGGPPRMMAALVRALDTTGPDYVDKLNHLARHGALDMRTFGESDLAFGTKQGVSDRIIDFVPGASAFQEASFGADGIVNRAKVALYDLARDMGMNDAQALNFVIEKTGTTVDALKPELVRAMTGGATLGLPIDPYFNRQLQVMKVAGQALGASPVGLQKRVLAGTLSSLVVWTALANWFASDEDEKAGTTMARFGPLRRDFRLGYVSKDGKQIPFLKNTDPAIERALRVFGVSAPLERYVAGDRDFNVLESGLKQAWTAFAQRLGPGFQTIRDVTTPTYDRFGNEVQKPKLKDALTANIPGVDAIIKARNDEDKLALSRGEEGSPLRRLIRGMTNVFIAPNEIDAKKDIQIENKLYRMDEREREDALLEIVGKAKQALPKRPDGTIIFKDGEVRRIVEKLIEDMPDGPEKNLFRAEAIQYVIGSGVKDIKINNTIRRQEGGK